ncbi:MAG: sigma 54-interacting transcriptional regulator [Peptostreptococcaceae bacterium]|nr:sigma 54-interacting transcriptional regulator [Peptostreptococcaceae bacterium]
MKKTIGFIVPNEEIEKKIYELFPKRLAVGELILERFDPDNMVPQALRLEKLGAKAIIARGGTYYRIVNEVKVPVVHLKMNALDILYAIKKASRIESHLTLILSEDVHFACSDWGKVLRCEIELNRFSTVNELEELLTLLEGRQKHTVVVGAVITCKKAEAKGFKTVFVDSRKETLQETIGYVDKILDDLEDQLRRRELSDTIVDNVHDAIIAVDALGNIILFNKNARKMFGKRSEDMIGCSIMETFPELDFIYELLKDTGSKSEKIVHMNKLIATVKASSILIDGEVNGAVCTFQDITKLQNLEKRIRFELNKKGLTAKFTFDNVLAEDEAMKKTVARAKRLSGTDGTIMIYGESGAGKEIIAQSIHNASERVKSPFVAVNCAALTESLLESELFGYEEGSFTGARKGGKPGLFELAHGGTIFLDEINSISLNLQSKLLRVLEEKEVMRIGSDYIIPLDIRIIGAANEDLMDKVMRGEFRRDLFYRLNVLELKIPPLRNRREDIIPLFHSFVDELIRGKEEMPEPDEGFKKMLLNHKWLGNVRELKNIAERYVIFKDDMVNPKELFGEESGSGVEILENSEINLKDINRTIEKMIIETFLSHGKTKTEIAEILGISRTALWKKLKD